MLSSGRSAPADPPTTMMSCPFIAVAVVRRACACPDVALATRRLI
jgi:hypothetical protein